MLCTMILFGFAGFLFALNAGMRAQLREPDTTTEQAGPYTIGRSPTGMGWVVRRNDWSVAWTETQWGARRWAKAHPDPYAVH